jgi:hypothetical protein
MIRSLARPPVKPFPCALGFRDAIAALHWDLGNAEAVAMAIVAATRRLGLSVVDGWRAGRPQLSDEHALGARQKSE